MRHSRRRFSFQREDRRQRKQIQIQDQILKRVPKHVTVFGINIVFDARISFEPLILLVSNICDKNPDGTPDKDGKPGGIGCAGGGLEHPKEFENPDIGLRREILEETGLWVSLCNIFRYSYEAGKVVYKGKGIKMGQKTTDTFEYGEQPRLRKSLRLWDVECLNPVFYSIALPHWEGTPHQKVFRELARRRTPDEVKFKGLFYDFAYDGLDKIDITPEKLGMTAEGCEEVDGIYLLPLTRVKQWFDVTPKKRGERGYTYFLHFRTLSLYADAIATWCDWLKDQLLKEAESALEAAPYLIQNHEAYTAPLRQAMEPLPDGGYNLPALCDAISAFCFEANTPNPVEKLHFREWLHGVLDEYTKTTEIPRRLADIDEVIKFYRKNKDLPLAS